MKGTPGAIAVPVMLLAGLGLSCAKQEPPPPEPVIRPVRYQRVERSGGVRVRSFSGAAKAGVETEISFRVGGTVNRLSIQVGDAVRQADLIAELDPRDYELQVEEIRASIAQARAQARNAKASYERVRGLYENNNAAKADLDASRTAAESAAANVGAVEKKIEMALLQVEYTKLLSPVDGAVAEVPVEVNENVSQGQTIAIVNSGAQPEVEVAVPESLITQIRRGDRVTVRFGALSDRAYGAAVTEVGITSTRSATTFPVTVRLNSPNPRILPGMAADVAFRFGVPGGSVRIVLPPQAVLEDRQGRHVFLVEPGDDGLGIVRRQPVQVGELVSDGLEITEGLREGALVVTGGVSQIHDGQQVRLLDLDQS